MPPAKRAKKNTTQNDTAHDKADQQIASTSARRNVRGKRGGLKEMPNMPLDILIEIFGVMHPKDLLNLARTSKPFRGLLMSRTSRSLWLASMKQVEDLPKCPPYMSEPAYINLLFFPHCHICLKPNIQTVLFEFSARYCNPCRQTVLCDWRKILHLSGSLTVSVHDMREWFPTISENGSMNSVRWHQPTLEQFRERWGTLDGEEAKQKLIDEYVARKEAVEEAAPDFHAWKMAQKRTRTAELDEIRAKRVLSIQDRLRDEGWAEELDLMKPIDLRLLAYEKFSTRAEALTARGWQKIRGDVIAYMERIKSRRLRAARKLTLEGHFKSFAEAYARYRPASTKRTKESDYDPQIIDLAFMPEFRSLLDVDESSDLSVLNDDEQMAAKFDAAIPQWRADRRAELLEMVQKAVQVPDDVDPLTLAKVVFVCRRCERGNLRYPEVIAHRCNHSTHWTFWGGDVEVYLVAAQSLGSHNARRQPWTSKCLEITEDTVSSMSKILRVCGLNPESATRQDADDCEARVTCTQCTGDIQRNDGYKRKVFTYHDVYTCSQALRHDFVQRSWSSSHTWARLSEDEVTAIKTIEEEAAAHPVPGEINWTLHGCAYCEHCDSRHRIAFHLLKEHDIEGLDDDLEEHCYLHSDADRRSPPLYLRRYVDGTFKVESGLLNDDLMDIWSSDSEYDYEDFEDDDDAFLIPLALAALF